MKFKKILPILTPLAIAAPVATIISCTNTDKETIVKHMSYDTKKDVAYVVNLRFGKQVFYRALRDEKNKYNPNAAINSLLNETISKLKIPDHVEKAQKQLEKDGAIPTRTKGELQFAIESVEDNKMISFNVSYQTKRATTGMVMGQQKIQDIFEKIIKVPKDKKTKEKLAKENTFFNFFKKEDKTGKDEFDIDTVFDFFVDKKKETLEKLKETFFSKREYLDEKLGTGSAKPIVAQGDIALLDYSGFLLNLLVGKEFKEEKEVTMDKTPSNAFFSTAIWNKIVGSTPGETFIGTKKDDEILIEFDLKDIKNPANASNATFVKNLLKYLKAAGQPLESLAGITKIKLYFKISEITKDKSNTSANNKEKVELKDKVKFVFKILAHKAKNFSAPFPGGTAEKQIVDTSEKTAGGFIKGFASGVVGHKLGETFWVYPTFPDNYKPNGQKGSELNGKTVGFEMKILKIFEKRTDNDAFYGGLNKKDELFFDFKNPYEKVLPSTGKRPNPWMDRPHTRPNFEQIAGFKFNHILYEQLLNWFALEIFKKEVFNIPYILIESALKVVNAKARAKRQRPDPVKAKIQATKNVKFYIVMRLMGNYIDSLNPQDRKSLTGSADKIEFDKSDKTISTERIREFLSRKFIDFLNSKNKDKSKTLRYSVK